MVALLVVGCVDLSPPPQLSQPEGDGAADLASEEGVDGLAPPVDGAGSLPEIEADPTPVEPDAGTPTIGESDAAGSLDAGAGDAEPDLASPGADPDVALSAGPDAPPDVQGAEAPANTSNQLVLRWAFDETMGAVTADSSGNGLHGTYLGTSGIPTPSTMTAPLQFPNPSSRAFERVKRHAVRLAPMPASLKPTNNVTVMAWYRATTVDTTGGELVSGGNSYLIRVTATRVEFAKRNVGVWVTCRGPVSNNHLDGKWHHLAGVSSSSGMKIYFDGVGHSCAPTGGDIVYDQGTDLWVGRHGRPDSNLAIDFEGNIDEVRIYRRALTDADILALAQGSP